MDMSGLYGMGGVNLQDPEALQRNFLAQTLLNGGNKGSAQIGNAMMAAMLMNPQMMDPLKRGLGNWANGYNWNGTPGASMMGDDLSAQAAGNIAAGAPI